MLIQTHCYFKIGLFFFFLLSFVSIYSEYKCLIKYMICGYFLTFCGLSFHFLNSNILFNTTLFFLFTMNEKEFGKSEALVKYQEVKMQTTQFPPGADHLRRSITSIPSAPLFWSPMIPPLSRSFGDKFSFFLVTLQIRTKLNKALHDLSYLWIHFEPKILDNSILRRL